MSLTYSYGYTDSVSAPKSINIPDLSYGKDFAVSKEEPSETAIVNITTPVDQTESIRFAITTIGNVYKDTGIDPAFYGASTKGFSLVAQVSDVMRVQDTENPAFCQDFPVSAHIVIKAPKSQYLSADNLMKVVNRAVASLYATGSTGTTRLNELVRGALTPSEL